MCCHFFAIMDDLLDDIDLDSLEVKPSSTKKAAAQPKLAPQKVAAEPVRVQSKTSSVDDFDALLDEALEENLSTAMTQKRDVADAVGDDLHEQMDVVEWKQWNEAVLRYPGPQKQKWTAMLKQDMQIESSIPLQPSYAYKMWDGPQMGKPGVSKALQELIRSAAAKSGLPEQKTARLQQIFDPLKSAAAKEKCTVFGRQLISDHQLRITSDANYDERRFPSLKKALEIV